LKTYYKRKLIPTSLGMHSQEQLENSTLFILKLLLLLTF
jgi:hypothetical protein